MLKVKILLLTTLIIVLISGAVAASNLSIGQENYNLRISNFSPFSGSSSDISLISVGYGQDKYSGFAADIFSSGKTSGVEIEYQFIPQSVQERKESFNYAAKIGAVSGDLWNQNAAGLKAGVIIKRVIDSDSAISFDADFINSSGIVIDAELSFYGRLSEGVMGVLGYKSAVHDEYGAVEGVHYGLKIDF